jgi:Ca2+-binding RTX toxin-like protein
VGRDVVFGEAGDDELFGGPGRDNVSGGPGDDFLVGNFGSDRLLGGKGGDILIGDSFGTPEEGAFDVCNGQQGEDLALPGSCDRANQIEGDFVEQ